MGMPPYTSTTRKVAYFALGLCAVVGMLITACKTSGDRRSDDQGIVAIVSHKPDTRTGAQWTYLTVDLHAGGAKKVTYTDKAEVAHCTVGTVWPRCVGK